MKQKLGTKCPECGTKDSPMMLVGHAVGCVRCGHLGVGPTFSDALAAFYGPQQEESDDRYGELPDCECGAMVRIMDNEGVLGQASVHCGNCGAQTPWFSTPAEASARWRRMMEG